MTILPTLTCFDDALDWLSRSVLERGEDCGLVLVHGICVMACADGEVRYSHAWVEQGDKCIDFGILSTTGEKIAYFVEREEYYKRRRVEIFTCYTAFEAAYENFKANHYGPWRPEYAALTRKRGEKPQIGT